MRFAVPGFEILNRQHRPYRAGCCGGLRVAALAILQSACPPQIGFLTRSSWKGRHIAFRQNVTACQHGDDVGKVGNQRSDYVRHQDGVFAEMRLISAAILSMSSCPCGLGRRAASFPDRAPASRDFERALAPVRHLDRGASRKLAQADIVEQFMGAAVETVEHRFGRQKSKDVRADVAARP